MAIERKDNGKFLITYRDTSGIKRRYTAEPAEAQTRKQAEAIEVQLRVGIYQSPVKQAAQGMLLKDAIDRCYREHWSLENKCPQGQLQKAYSVLEVGGNVTINTIDDEWVDGVKLALTQAGNAKSTVNKKLNALQVVLKQAKRWKYNGVPAITVLPDIQRYRNASNQRTRYYSEDEEDMIFEALTLGYERLYVPECIDLFIILLDTGVRLGEGLNHRIHDTDFGANILRVRKNKTDKPRAVPMTGRVRTVLERYRDEGINHPFAGLDKRKVNAVWDWVRDVIGLQSDPEAVVHTMRHTCASRLVMGGMDLYRVKEWLGHKSIRSTEIYAHLSPLVLESGITILERNQSTRALDSVQRGVQKGCPSGEKISNIRQFSGVTPCHTVGGAPVTPGVAGSSPVRSASMMNKKKELEEDT